LDVQSDINIQIFYIRH